MDALMESCITLLKPKVSAALIVALITLPDGSLTLEVVTGLGDQIAPHAGLDENLEHLMKVLVNQIFEHFKVTHHVVKVPIGEQPS